MTTTEQQPRTHQAPVGNFYILRQDGMLGVRDGARILPSEWRAATQSDREKVKAKWNDARQILGVALNSRQLAMLIDNKEARDRATESMYERFGNMYEIEGGSEVVASKFREYSSQANRTINGIISSARMTNFPIRFEMANEVQAKDNPVDLAILALDGRYAPRVRFEAKRKLELMDLAAKIDDREKKAKTNEHYVMFTDFLDEHVYQAARRGDAEYSYILSNHDAETNACANTVTVLSEEEGESRALDENQRLTLLPRRKFNFNGRDIPIYVTPREKSAEAKILKLLRKGAENPALAVDDEIGFMGVLNTPADVEAFKKQLVKSAASANSMLTFEEVENSLTGEEHTPNSIGSSSEVRMFKCFIRMGGTRIEMILHTNQTYLDYLYREGVAHEEYETKRLFDSSVMGLLFPPDIYNYDLDKARASSLENVRNSIRSK